MTVKKKKKKKGPTQTSTTSSSVEPAVAMTVVAADKKLGPEELAKLKELKELLDNHVLTQDEFNAQKMAVLA